jgi:tRNA 5-methylaminomethyl-2-thiouridine biosynthesis bifunctional protein
MKKQLEGLGLPSDYVRVLSAQEASRISGLPIASPAWFYPGGGWVEPAALAASFLARAGASAELRLDAPVAELRRQGARWQLLDAAGQLLGDAPVVVLANAFDALRLLGSTGWPVHRARGQTTELAASTPGLRLPLLPVAGDGYVLPALPGGVALFGATSQPDDADPALRDDDHRHNLERLARLTGSAPALEGDAALGGRVGWRCVTDDRLPVIGAVPDRAALQNAHLRLDQPRFVPREPGLFVFTALASRGITWAALGAQTLAAWVSGSPGPLEASLLDAVDVGRFDARASRRA